MLKEKAMKKTMTLNTRNTLIGISFILPNFLGFLVFILIPVIFSFGLSFAEWDGFNTPKFVGINNFIEIFGDRIFREAISITFLYTTFTVVFSLIAALGLALLLNRKMRGVNFFRSAVFFPYVASVVAVAAVWQAMLMRNGGPVNTFLTTIGIDNPPGWFTSTDWAIWGVILVSVWKNMGYFMIIYLAALQDIPASLYEAANIDGASKTQTFWSITFPMLTPAHFFVLMMLIINSFKTFDLVYLLTEGGPGTSTKLIAHYIYDESFTAWNFGTASAASMVLFFIIGIITLFQFRMEKKFNESM